MSHSARLEQAAANLIEVEALMIDDPTDLFYLTGLELSLGKLFIFKTQRPILCVDGRYEEACLSQTAIDVQLWDRQSAPPFPLPARVGFDPDNTSVTAYEHCQQLMNIQLIPIHAPILQQRMIKDAGEIMLLQQAADLGSQGFDRIKEWLKVGITEKELTLELEIFWRRLGGDKVAFDPIIAFGENSSRPHHRASQRALKQGDIVLIDIGVTRQRYHSDMTRVLFFGDADPQLIEIYHLVHAAAEIAYTHCRPGVAVGDIDAAARHHIESAGHRFVHGLGHGVGLEIHELPRLRTGTPGAQQPLVPGMVLTIEPGIYLPGKGGVRLEDTIVITPSGYQSLTQRPLHYRSASSL